MRFFSSRSWENDLTISGKQHLSFHDNNIDNLWSQKNKYNFNHFHRKTENNMILFIYLYLLYYGLSVSALKDLQEVLPILSLSLFFFFRFSSYSYLFFTFAKSELFSLPSVWILLSSCCLFIVVLHLFALFKAFLIDYVLTPHRLLKPF